MNNSLSDNFQRALRFTLKSGNICHILLIAAIFCISDAVSITHLLTYRSSSGMAMLLQLAAALLMTYKLLDNAARLRLGLDGEPVPLAPTSVIGAELPWGMIALGFVLGVLAGIIGAYLQIFRPELIYVLLILLFVTIFALNPVVTLAVLKAESSVAAFSPRQWRDAINDMGVSRYFALLGITGAMLAVIFLVIYVGITPEIENKLESALFVQAYGGSETFSLPAFMYFYYFLANTLLVAIAFFNQHCYACAYPRKDNKDPHILYG